MTQKRTRSARSRALLPALVVAAGTAAAIPAITSGQSPGERTITVQEKVSRIELDDLAPRTGRNRVSQGDRLVTTQALFSSPGSRAGTLYTDCTGVGQSKPLFGGAKLLCTTTYELSDGQIVAAGAIRLGRPPRLAITGGTGAYEGASGSVEPVKPARGFDSADVLRLTD